MCVVCVSHLPYVAGVACKLADRSMQKGGKEMLRGKVSWFLLFLFFSLVVCPSRRVRQFPLSQQAVLLLLTAVYQGGCRPHRGRNKCVLSDETGHPNYRGETRRGWLR